MGAEQSDQRGLTGSEVPPSVSSSQSSSPYHCGSITESASYAPYPSDSHSSRDTPVGVGRLREASDRLRSRLRVSLSQSSSTADSRVRGVVVVNTPSTSLAQPADDVLTRLQALPNFEPILHTSKPPISAAATPSTTVDTDRLLKSIDNDAAYRVASELTRHLSSNAQTTTNAQSQLITQIANVDRQLGVLMASFTDSQYAFARHAERLQVTSKLKGQLDSCTEQLGQILQLVAEINSRLPISSRLPPFSSVCSIRKKREQSNPTAGSE